MDRYCLIVLGPKLSISVESFCRCEPDSSDELIGRARLRIPGSHHTPEFRLGHEHELDDVL